MELPVVLYFARGYQADYFPTLRPQRHSALFVTMTVAEQRAVEARGGRVVGCFEAEFGRITARKVAPDYLHTSLMSDRFLGRLHHDARMSVLGKEIAFWVTLLDKYAPLAVVNELVAIEVSEVLLVECRRRGVRYLAGMNCPVDDWFYWLPDPASLSGRHLRTVEPGAQAMAIASEYMRQVAAKDYKPFYVKNLRTRRDLLPLAVAAAKWLMWKWRRISASTAGSFRYELYDDEYAKRIIVYLKSLVMRYDQLQDIPADSEIVFYPLHQEPEATLNYMSEFYANQAATIENILKCLNCNQVLVVKEHPVDKGSLLREKFRSLRRQCSGLYYLPAEVHGREVLARARRVVTLTSTVGWEAAIVGRRVYVLGQIFYDCVPGVVAIRSLEQLRSELRSEVADRDPEVEQITRFVAGMIEQSYPGNPFPHKDLYSELNRQRVIHAIEHAIGIGGET